MQREQRRSRHLVEIHIAAQVRKHARHIRRKRGASGLGGRGHGADGAVLRVRATSGQHRAQVAHQRLQEFRDLLLCNMQVGFQGNVLPVLLAKRT